MSHKSLAAIGTLALASAVLLAGGCSNSNPTASGGKIRMIFGASSTQAATLGGTTGAVSPTTLDDGSGRTITSASISLSSILARNLDGQLIDVTVDLPMTVDLISLIQGGTAQLPIGSLPVGSYDQIVIVIKSLDVVLSDGTQIDVTPPGGGWTVIVPTQPFDVVDGQVTTVTLNFQPAGAFHWIDGQLEFNPQFDCHVDDHGEDGGHHH